jgi:hypothetical protein
MELFDAILQLDIDHVKQNSLYTTAHLPSADML